MNTEARNEKSTFEEIPKSENEGITVEIPESTPVGEEHAHNLSDDLVSFEQNFLSEAFRKSVISPLQSRLADYAKTVSLMGLSAALDTFSSVIQNIKGIVGHIHVPEISEERKQELLNSHELWGSYGWTLIPIADDKLFDLPPTDKKEANMIARKACKDTESLFSNIRNQKRVKSHDFNEAVCDFQDKRYKSCALILFGLIDAHLIRFQRRAETKGMKRLTGAGAVARARQRVQYDDPCKSLFVALFYINLFTCLDKVFENTTDFKKETSVINRNYLNHGMLTRKVTRTDCLQLFLLYCNVLDMLDLTYLTGD